MLTAEKTGLKPASDIAQGAGSDSSAPSAVLPGKPSQHDARMRYRRFAASNTAKKVHHIRTRLFITKSMRREIPLVYKALCSPWICMRRPICHLTSRSPSVVGYSDSCLHAAGGYILDIGFWRYINWPLVIQQSTLRFIYNNKDGKLISINALEYASLIINYVAAWYVLTHVYPTAGDPHPVVLLYADNRTAESWLIKTKQTSHAGRTLTRRTDGQ